MEMVCGALAVLNVELKSGCCGPEGRYLKRVDGALWGRFVEVQA